MFRWLNPEPASDVIWLKESPQFSLNSWASFHFYHHQMSTLYSNENTTAMVIYHHQANVLLLTDVYVHKFEFFNSYIRGFRQIQQPTTPNPGLFLNSWYTQKWKQFSTNFRMDMPGFECQTLRYVYEIDWHLLKISATAAGQNLNNQLFWIDFSYLNQIIWSFWFKSI